MVPMDAGRVALLLVRGCPPNLVDAANDAMGVFLMPRDPAELVARVDAAIASVLDAPTADQAATARAWGTDV